MTADRRPRIPPLLAAGGAVAVAVGVVAVILLFGLREPPSYPVLSASSTDDRLAGRIAYIREDDQRSCVVVVDLPDGARHDVACSDGGEWYGGGEVSWDDEGRLRLVRYEPTGPMLVTVDPETGRELDREPVGGEGKPYPEGPGTIRPGDEAELTWRSDDGSVRLLLREGDEERTLLSARGPRDYSLWDAGWSPDGRWAFVADSEQRLLLVAVTSPARTLLLTDDGHSPAWTPVD